MDKKLFGTLLAACCTIAIAPANATETETGNPLVYPQAAHPYGASIDVWAERSIQWLYAQPFEHHPFFDPTGADCGVGQQGPMWYLAPIFSTMAGDWYRSCTIPRDKAILLQVGYVSETYPCPFPFEPAPGQSLYDFLLEDSWTYLRPIKLDVSLDGQPIKDALGYHYISEDLYEITGDLSLQTTFDPCITGSPQPALINGYFIPFRALAPGQHTLVRRTTNVATGTTNTFTYYLTIR